MNPDTWEAMAEQLAEALRKLRPYVQTAEWWDMGAADALIILNAQRENLK